MVSFSIKIYGSILNINLKWFIGQEIIWNEEYWWVCVPAYTIDGILDTVLK
jgi:hypothetical protein